MSTIQSPATTESRTSADALKLVMVQANPTVGAIRQNLEQILIQRRANADADLIVLSECFLTGYPLQDLVGLPHFIAEVTRAINELQIAIRNEPGPAVLFGAPTPGADKPYNSAILIRADGTLAMTHKRELPNNDVFDEVRNFAQGAGKAIPLRLNEQWSLGVMICEDGWHKQVASDLEGEGANILISINGSPAKLGKQQQRLLHMRRRVAETGLPLVYVNQFGGQDELVFDGSSFALNDRGEVIAKLAFMDGDSTTLQARQGRRGQVLLERTQVKVQMQAITDTELMYRQGVLGTRDYANKNNRSFIHLGVSGGADSALALAMACDAVGPERVIGYRLPSKFTSDESMELAEQIIKRFGCKMETVDISGMATATIQAIAHLPYDSEAARRLAAENVLPRLRMTVLRAGVNLKGGMLLGTSNMSESLVGYTTIDGDMAADYNPLKNLHKDTDVFDAMAWRNAHIPATSLSPIENPIPQEIIDRTPSAENEENQTDEATLGSYKVLGPCLRGMVEHQFDAETTRRKVEHELGITIDPAYVISTSDRIFINEFKRRQACIGSQIRDNSLGLGRRYPITNHFREPRPA